MLGKGECILNKSPQAQKCDSTLWKGHSFTVPGLKQEDRATPCVPSAKCMCIPQLKLLPTLQMSLNDCPLEVLILGLQVNFCVGTNLEITNLWKMRFDCVLFLLNFHLPLWASLELKLFQILATENSLNCLLCPSDMSLSSSERFFTFLFNKIFQAHLVFFLPQPWS